MRKDQSNDMPPQSSSTGVTQNGNRTDSPDMENSGGNIPNTSITWGGEAMDRMEGSIKGKNKPQSFGNKTTYKDPTAI